MEARLRIQTLSARSRMVCGRINETTSEIAESGGGGGDSASLAQHHQGDGPASSAGPVSHGQRDEEEGGVTGVGEAWHSTTEQVA